MNRKVTQKLVLTIVAVFCLTPQKAEGKWEAETFPEYPAIAANVAFWKDIYSKYTSRQGILHDSRHLEIVYETVPLNAVENRNDQKRNSERVERIRAKWRAILERLAAGGEPIGSEEERVRNLFRRLGIDRPGMLAAARNIRLQKGLEDRFRQGVIVSGAYLEKIMSIFQRHGLSTDLAYLPHVESSYNYNAYSKFGAAGIWQFTRSTGKQYLKIDSVIDERRDPMCASDAAARFLKAAYRKFGNWPLAITSYNYGMNGMRRAVKKHGSYEAIFRNYKRGLFRFASRNFYSEFLAAREVAKHYKKYFGPLQLAQTIQLSIFPMPGYVSAKAIMEYFQIESSILTHLNPALGKSVIKGDRLIPKDYLLKLPALPHYRRLAENLPDSMFRERQLWNRLYRVQQGDVASRIARRFRVPLQSIVQANRLNSRVTIYAGQILHIPTEE